MKHPERKRSVPTGITYGLVMATAYSGLAGFIYLLTDGAAFRAQNISIGSAITAYFLGGIVGGAVFGYFLPMTSTRTGSVIVGILTAIPVSFGFGLAMWGPPGGWSADGRLTVIIFALIMGGAAGYISWVPPTPPDHRSMQ